MRVYDSYCVSAYTHRSTTWILTKRIEEKLDTNSKKIRQATLTLSWKQYPTHKQQPSISKKIQIRRSKHAGHCRRSKGKLISDVLLWTPFYGR